MASHIAKALSKKDSLYFAPNVSKKQDMLRQLRILDAILKLQRGSINMTLFLSLKTQQRFSVFGTCFDVSNIIISHYEYIVKIYKSGRYTAISKKVALVIHDA